MRRFIDEPEAGGKVEMTGGSKRVICSQHKSAVSGCAREVDSLGDQAAA